MLSTLAIVVVIVIDQFRTDELLRAQQQLNPAGIGLLVNKGVFYDDAHHTQFFNMTCPGHTAISTGAQPGLHGIMVNDDFDRTSQKPIYCVADHEHHWIDAENDNKDTNLGTSPKRILTSTLGDELKMINGHDSKVIAVALKDRSAIALGGHAADGAFFYAPRSGHWTSSDYYFPDKKLPQWLLDYNSKRPLVKPSADESYEHSKQSVEDTTDVALAAARGEKLGSDKKPDMLWVSYSTHDYVGHTSGDDSPELKAILKAEDQSIARLITGLKKQAGSKKILVVLTADHGAGVDTEVTAHYKIPAGKLNEKESLQKINDCLAKRGVSAVDGKAPAAELTSMNLFLSSTVKDREKVAVEAKACFNDMQDGVYHAFTRADILSNQVPQTTWLKNLASSYNTIRGADVVGVLEPYWNSHGKTRVSHETPYSYDSWVPLAFWWPGVSHKLIHRRAEVVSMAPTLARILETRRPSGAEADLLPEILDGTLK